MSSEDSKMKRISEVAKQTGVSVNTIRRWAEKGLLKPARRRTEPKFIAWYTTAEAVMAVVKNPPKMGRPRKGT